MAGTPQDARLRFLDRSACVYADLSPAVSAHLMLQRTQDSATPSPMISPCTACGTILTSGRTSQTRIETTERKASKNKRLKKDDVREKFLIVKCLACHHYVKTPLKRAPKPLKTAKMKQLAEMELMMTPEGQSAIAPGDVLNSASVNSGSKKRAKSRKGGLQAMLEKSKQTPKPSLDADFDLMDFMKRA